MMERLHMNQAGLAAALGVNQSLVSRWLGGRVAPSVEMLVKLSAMAQESDPKTADFFWDHTGLNSEALISRLGSILERRVRPVVGDQVAIPRRLWTASGAVDLGSSASLPADIVPHPATTVLASFDRDNETWAEDLPAGRFLLETSAEGAQTVLGLFGVGLGIMVGYAFRRGANPIRRATYVGSLFLDLDEDDIRHSPREVPVRLGLSPLMRRRSTVWLGAYTDRDGPRGMVDNGRAAVYRRKLEILRRAEREITLDSGFRIMGVVYGWLDEAVEPEG
jgi:transcriptional regulator with XRE-family HTH domain